MPRGKHRRAVLVAVQDGAQNGCVVVPLRLLACRFGLLEKHGCAFAEALQQVAQHLVLPSGRELLVEQRVEGGKLVIATRDNGLRASREYGRDTLEDPNLLASGRQAGVVPLEQGADLDDLLRLLLGNPGDDGAAPRRDLDEALGGKGADGLAHGIAGHAQVPGEALLHQAVAGLDAAGADRFAQFGGDTAGQRGVAGADGPFQRRVFQDHGGAGASLQCILVDINEFCIQFIATQSYYDLGKHGSQMMATLMNHVEFRTALENAIKGKSANKAPFSLAWAAGKLSRAHLARWAENHFHYVGPFADYLAYVYARMPDRYTEAKDFLLSNMYEEEVGGDRHTDLLIRFAESCGTTAARVKDPDNMSPTTRGLQSWCYAVAMREDPIVAVAGLVVGLESQVPSIYRKQTPTLRDTYGFTDEEVEFFDLHIVSDEIHGERGYQIVLEHADTVDLQQRCLRICEIGAEMRLLYTTALYRDYVEAELPFSQLQLAA